MLQTTSTIITPSIICHATLSMRNVGVTSTVLRLARPCAHTYYLGPRRTFVSSSSRNVTLTDPTAHKEATGPHYRMVVSF